jgi:predicted RNase H-like HicB family nuclease
MLKGIAVYRVGLPGWKLAARLGVPLHFRVHIKQDLEANVYWACSPDLDGLVVEGATLDEIKSEAEAGARLLLELALDNPRVHARFPLAA